MWSVHIVSIHRILNAVDWVKNTICATHKKLFFYTCQFCTNYKCIKYEKPVYYGRKGTLNNSQFELINNKPNDPCYCRPGKMIYFLFSDFQIISSLKYIASKKLIKQKTSLNKQVTKKTYAQFLTKSTV